jgi:hypothetical protein
MTAGVENEDGDEIRREDGDEDDENDVFVRAMQ